MDRFDAMQAFARVVESGSFTAAAQALQSAKSSVSETVRALEERMGVRLLDRTTRRVRPTEAGNAFYRHCRRLLDDLGYGFELSNDLHGEPIAADGMYRLQVDAGLMQTGTAAVPVTEHPR